MGNKVLAILFLYWYWYGPYIYQQVLILVLVMLFWAQKYSILISNTFSKIRTSSPEVTGTGTTETSFCHCPAAFASESNQDQTQVTAASPPSKDFFARITSKRNATTARPDADAEVESYLSDPSNELSSLEAYPNIRQVYLKLNQPMPQ